MQNGPFHTTKKRTWIWALAAMLAIVLLSSCKNDSGTSGSGSNSGLALEGPKETVSLYRNNCISCHGSDLQGKMGDESDLRHIGSKLTLEAITRQIKEGGALMPAMESRLTIAEIEDLARWLSEHK